MRNRKPVTICVIGMALAAGLFFIQVKDAAAKKHHSDRRQSDEGIFTDPRNIDTTYADWMSGNKEILKDLPINRIPLLGSHDAGSCYVNRKSPPCTGYLTHSNHHIHRMPRGTDVTSARCQSASIKDQLRYGVRYLDLRVARQEKAYWIEHMWLSTPLFGDRGVFAGIKDFLRVHPREIVILNMQALYSETGEMTAREADAYFQKVEKEFGDMLSPAGDFAKTTAGDVWAKGARLIIVADTRLSARPFLWPESKVDNRWMDMGEPGELCGALDGRVVSPWREGRCSEKLRVLQAMTTTKHKILKARETNAEILKRLQADWMGAPLNVVQVDDSVNSGLMRIMIERLKKDR